MQRRIVRIASTYDDASPGTWFGQRALATACETRVISTVASTIASYANNTTSVDDDDDDPSVSSFCFARVRTLFVIILEEHD